jgi:hypothetical protein
MYDELIQLAQAEFGDILARTETIGRRAGVALKMRVHLVDATIVDVWLSPDLKRYAYHWEQRAVRGLLHRHDNAPDHPDIPTFPKHFHNGSEESIEASYPPDDPTQALRSFLSFVRDSLNNQAT